MEKMEALTGRTRVCAGFRDWARSGGGVGMQDNFESIDDWLDDFGNEVARGCEGRGHRKSSGRKR
jgi:hypothetical protein